MTDHNCDKDQLDQARTINDEIKVTILSPLGKEVAVLAAALPTAKLIAELRSRVEALEANPHRRTTND